MPIPIEGVAGKTYEELVQQYTILMRERAALARKKRRDRGQQTRFMRLTHDVIPRLIARLTRLQEEMQVY